MRHRNSRPISVTRVQVRQVRRLLQDGWSQREIANQVGVSQITVHNIYHNKGWYGRVQMRQKKEDSPNLQKKVSDAAIEELSIYKEKSRQWLENITQDKKGDGGTPSLYTQAIKDFRRLAVWVDLLNICDEEAFTYLPKVLEVLSPFFNVESIQGQ